MVLGTCIVAINPMINLFYNLFALNRGEEYNDNQGTAQNADDSNTYYYPRDTQDVFETAFILQQVLVADVIPAILDAAQYWRRRAAEESKGAVCKPHQSRMPYLSIDIQPHEARWVRQVVFTVESRDQGWSSYPQDHGTYRNSWTWFEAALSKADMPGSPRRRRLFTNVHASSVFTTHTVVWSDDSADKEEREWVRGLRAGDMLSIVPMARFPGWENKVGRAKIEVFSAAIR